MPAILLKIRSQSKLSLQNNKSRKGQATHHVETSLIEYAVNVHVSSIRRKCMDMTFIGGWLKEASVPDEDQSCLFKLCQITLGETRYFLELYSLDRLVKDRIFWSQSKLSCLKKN